MELSAYQQWLWAGIIRVGAEMGEPIISPTKCRGGVYAWEAFLLHLCLCAAAPIGCGQGSALPTGDLSNLCLFPEDLPSHPTAVQRWVGLYCLRALLEMLCLTWLLCCYWSHLGYSTISWKLIALQGECHYDEIIRASTSNSSTESFLTGAPSEVCCLCPSVSGHL